MKVLLIGANSLVAKSFVRLFGQDHEISTLGKGDRLADLSDNAYDTVVFLAQSKDHKSGRWTDDLFETNVNLLFRIIQSLSIRHFIYFSTGSVYAPSLSGHYQVDSPLNLVNPTPYAASKITGEAILAAHGHLMESQVILRPFYIYGPGQKENMLVRSLFTRIADGSPVRLAQDVGMVFNPVFADDVAVLLNQLVCGTSSGRRVLNVAGSEEVTLRQVVDLIGAAVGRSPNLQSTPDCPVKMLGDVTITGWSAVTSLAEGIQRCASSLSD